jgi:hypothetical protein
MAYKAQLEALAISMQAQLSHTVKTPPPALIGLVGTGKTSANEQVAQALGLNCYVISLPQVLPEALGGLPYADLEAGVVKFLPADFFKAIVDNGDDKSLLFFDEIADAPRNSQSALHKILTHREAGSLKLPRCAMGSAMNPPDQSTTGGSISEAIATRSVQLPWDGWSFEESLRADSIANDLIYEVPKLTEGWEGGYQEACIKTNAFLESSFGMRFRRTRPKASTVLGDHVLGMAAPQANSRTWRYAKGLIAACDALGRDAQAAKLLLVSGCVGEDAAREYILFEQNEWSLPKVEDCLNGTAKIPYEGYLARALLLNVVSHVTKTLPVKRKEYDQAWAFIERMLGQGTSEDLVATAVAPLCRPGALPKGFKGYPKAITALLPIIKAMKGGAR